MNPVEPIAERQNSGESAWMARQLDYAKQQATRKGAPLRADEVALRIRLRQALGESGMDVLIVFGDDNFTYVTGAALPFAPEVPDRRAVVVQRADGESVIICPLDWAEAIRQQGWPGRIDVYDESSASAHDALVRSLAHALETMGLGRGRAGVDMARVPVSIEQKLRQALPATRIGPGRRATQRAAAGQAGERDRAARDGGVALREGAGQCAEPHRRHHRRHQLRRLGVYRASESARRRVRRVRDRACRGHAGRRRQPLFCAAPRRAAGGQSGSGGSDQYACRLLVERCSHSGGRGTDGRSTPGLPGQYPAQGGCGRDVEAGGHPAARYTPPCRGDRTRQASGSGARQGWVMALGRASGKPLTWIPPTLRRWRRAWLSWLGSTRAGRKAS